MVILKFLKNIFVPIITCLKRIYRVSLCSNKNKTCDFSYNCDISEATFGKYIKIFGNSIVYKSNIGDYTYIQLGCRIYNTKIGKFCSIGPEVSIAPGQHNLNRVTTHPTPYYNGIVPLPKKYGGSNDGLEKIERVIIGHDVWIGQRSTIMDGVEIGTGAIIGAGSVVTKDVRPYEIVAGVPARHIRFRFPEQIIRVLLDSEWWNKSEEWFIDNNEIFNNVTGFVDFFSSNASKNT